jgi:hypothetical protein
MEEVIKNIIITSDDDEDVDEDLNPENLFDDQFMSPLNIEMPTSKPKIMFEVDDEDDDMSDL